MERVRPTAVLDHNRHPVAGVAVTFASDSDADPATIARTVTATAAQLTRRVSGSLAT